ncbi:MAG: helix-turn-helix transcriptional regulator, partial [Chloroflexi bacterium]|nr:helix-turn-helix transcriptional regulator [Chloroflexota bacterium]
MQRALSKLAAARARKHWTLEQAAEYIGTNANTLYRWEKGKAMPRAYNIEKLCEVYEAAASDLGLEGNYITAEQNTSAPTETTEAADDGLNPWRKQDLTLRLMKLLWQWPRRNTRYHLLQAQIVQETEEYSSMSQEIEYLIGRREALHCLAFLPIELCGLSKLGPILNYPAEEILTQCAAGVTACWYLHRGKELALTSHIVESYLPTLKAIAKSSSSQHRKAAADLLTQCVLLKAALARHLEGTREAISYMQQAVTYSKVAENAMLHIIALRTLSIAYYYANQWKQALQAVEEATYLLEHAYATPMPKLLHSCVYAVLANRQALNGQKQDALTSLGQAHTTFHQQTTG